MFDAEQCSVAAVDLHGAITFSSQATESSQGRVKSRLERQSRCWTHQSITGPTLRQSSCGLYVEAKWMHGEPLGTAEMFRENHTFVSTSLVDLDFLETSSSSIASGAPGRWSQGCVGPDHHVRLHGVCSGTLLSKMVLKQTIPQCFVSLSRCVGRLRLDRISLYL